MSAESRRAAPYIDSDIKYSSLDYPHQLALRMRSLLEMQTAENPMTGLGFIILHKTDFPYLRIEVPLGEGLEEIASMISENAGFKNDKPRYICLNYIHLLQF